MSAERIEKFISSRTNYSRREAKELLKAGRVKINGKTAPKNTKTVDPLCDSVEVDLQLLDGSEYVYLMMNKPKGVISASSDKSKKTVVDLLPDSFNRSAIFPVGRLDRDTTGLLILTNDGDFAHTVISPKSKIEKVYIAELDGKITEDTVNRFAEGVILADGTKCLPAKLIIGENPFFGTVKIFEGKYHQIKRMFGTVGLGVVSLHRESVGGVKLDGKLEAGEIRRLTAEEINLIKIAHKS